MPPAQTLKELRNELRISQDELSAALQVSQPLISLWECGKRTPNRASVQAITAAINDLLIAAGSARRVNYDEIDAALLAGAGVVRSPSVDIQGDLRAIDHRTTAPTAQGA